MFIDTIIDKLILKQLLYLILLIVFIKMYENVICACKSKIFKIPMGVNFIKLINF
jgi:hypothetical protein